MTDTPGPRKRRPRGRPAATHLVLAITGAGLMLLSHPAPAAGQPSDSTAAPRSAGGLKAKGYLSARYAYVGSSSAATVYSGLRLTGSFQLSALSDRIVFKYRSHHWLNFARTEKHVLESAFANRNIIHTGYVETDGLLARGLRARLGRFIPETDYSSSPVIDGAALAYEFGGFTVGGAAGVMVDLWDGRETSNDILAAAHLKYRTDRVRVSAGYQKRVLFRHQTAGSAGRPQRHADEARLARDVRRLRFRIQGNDPRRSRSVVAGRQGKPERRGLAVAEPLRPALSPRQEPEPRILGALLPERAFDLQRRSPVGLLWRRRVGSSRSARLHGGRPFGMDGECVFDAAFILRIQSERRRAEHEIRFHRILFSGWPWS